MNSVIIQKYGVAQTHTHPDAHRKPMPPHKRKKAVSTRKSNLTKRRKAFDASSVANNPGYHRPGSERK